MSNMEQFHPMSAPTFDSDGYPTEETLKAISDWPFADREGLIDFIREAWKYPDYFAYEDGKLHLSTAGWSGNESIIEALEGNAAFWTMCWQSSHRGGHYQFKIPLPRK